MAEIEQPRPLRRSPIWPALLSGLVAPGVGQIFNRDYMKGILLLVSSIGAFLWFLRVVTIRLLSLLPGTPDEWTAKPEMVQEALTKIMNESPQMFSTLHVLLIVVWVFGIIDAYLTARKNLLRPSAEEEKTSGDENE